MWTWIGGNGDERPKGEVGILKQVKPVDGQFVNRCFLWMQYQDSTYVGCLLLTATPFCHQLSNLLEKNCGQSVEYIGGLDLSHLG